MLVARCSLQFAKKRGSILPICGKVVFPLLPQQNPNNLMQILGLTRSKGMMIGPNFRGGHPRSGMSSPPARLSNELPRFFGRSSVRAARRRSGGFVDNVRKRANRPFHVSGQGGQHALQIRTCFDPCGYAANCECISQILKPWIISEAIYATARSLARWHRQRAWYRWGCRAGCSGSDSSGLDRIGGSRWPDPVCTSRR